MDFFIHIKNLIYPNICRSCSNILTTQEQIICVKCIHNLPYTYFAQQKNNEVFNLFLGRVPIQFAATLCYFNSSGVIQNLMHQLKYGGQAQIGHRLGKILGHTLNDSPIFECPDIIVPVPIHPKKLKVRGYNQAELIANGISEVLEIPVQTQGLQKIIHTQTQTKKSKFERWINVERSFRKSESIEIKNKKVLLVDDVITTGATLEACSQSLLKMGDNKISIATIAYAQ